MEKVIVSGWNDGKQDRRGNGYGIRVGKINRELFGKDWDHFQLSIESANFFTVNITPGFWRNCTEFRSAIIGKWLVSIYLASWEKGLPPKFELTKIGGNKFQLDRTKDTIRYERFMGSGSEVTFIPKEK